MLTPTMLASNPVANAVGLEVASSHNVTPARERYVATETDPPPANYQNIQTTAAVLPAKVGRLGNPRFLL